MSIYIYIYTHLYIYIYTYIHYTYRYQSPSMGRARPLGPALGLPAWSGVTGHPGTGPRARAPPM